MRFSKRTKRKLQELTPLDAQRESKLRAEEEAEKIDIMGQENEKKAAKWVMENQKEEDKKETKEKADTLEKLTDARGKVFTYKDALHQALQRELLSWSHQLPTGYRWQGGITEKGIVLYISTPDNQWYARGMKPLGLPQYDLTCLTGLIIKALASIDELEERKLKKTESGIILPS